MRHVAAALLLLTLPATALCEAEDRDVLARVPDDLREEVSSALNDAGRNAPELEEAIGSVEGEERGHVLWLLTRMPHLDRLEMTGEILVEHVRLATARRGGLPDSLFRPYVLTYRVGREPVEAWRSALARRWDAADGDVLSTVRSINRDVASSVSERDREFFGPTQPPLFTLSAGTGTESEIAVLTTAALRAAGIPARRARVPALGAGKGGASWIEFHDGHEWTPLYPLHPEALGDAGWIERDHATNVTVVEASAGFETVLVTERYSDTGTLDVAFVSDGRPAGGFGHFSISVLNDGAIVPLDALEAAANDSGRFRAELGDGRYIVAAGVRDEDGDPLVRMLNVTLEAGESRGLAFDVTPRDAVPAAGPVEAWVAIDPANEPDVRMLPLIASALDARDADATYVAVGDGARPALRAALGASARIVSVEELPGDARFRSTLESAAETPVIALYEPDGGASILLHTGYDLNVARRIESAGAGEVQ